MAGQKNAKKSQSIDAKNQNKGGFILAGDWVKLCPSDRAGGEMVIEKIKERKNRFIRPAIANIDQLFIVIASYPQPDLKMVDKLIVNGLSQNIDPIICLNKSDINSPDFVNQISAQYKHRKIVHLSGQDGQIDAMIPLIKNKLTALCGQSAVGKSTIINAILGNSARKTQGLSQIGRGKNTTTDTQLFSVFGGLVADTPGFSLADTIGVDHNDLDLFYPEFASYLGKCKYHRCNHLSEPDCAVTAAVSAKKINKERFDRYQEIFKQIKEKRDSVFK